MLSNLFNEKYLLKLGEFKNTTRTERGNMYQIFSEITNCYLNFDSTNTELTGLC